MFPPPSSNIDWSKLGLATDVRLNGHIQARYLASKKEWTAPVLVKDHRISVSGMSPGLNYGQQCYEGMKALRHSPSSSPNQSLSDRIVVFRPQFHAARLARSAESVCLPAPPEALFLECIRRAVACNAEFVPPADTDGFLYIRPVLFGASAQLALVPPEEIIFAVFVHPVRPYHGSSALDALVLEDFDRAAPYGMGRFKVGGNYAPVWRHAARAREMGYGITLHLDSATRTRIEEFSTSGFMGLAQDDNKKTLVVAKSGNAIQSATSDTIARIAELEGWKVKIQEVEFESLATLTEVVAVGTAAAAVPIRSITRLSTKDKFTFSGTSGSEGVQSRLLGLATIMSEIQRGRRDDSEGWCWDVTLSPAERSEILAKEAFLHEDGGGKPSKASWLFSGLSLATLFGLGISLFRVSAVSSGAALK